MVYNPECSNHKPKANYIDQAQWEREALSNASVIVFWIPRKLPDMPGFTINVEFGYWLYNVDTKQKPYNTIEDLLSSAMLQADN